MPREMVTLDRIRLTGLLRKSPAKCGAFLYDRPLRTRHGLGDPTGLLPGTLAALWQKAAAERRLARDFSADDGEATPTLNLKRPVCEHHFAAEIESLYAEALP